MLPLLLLTTLLLPLTQGETCLSRQDLLDIVKEMETKMAEMETKLSKKDAEIEDLKAKMDEKVDVGDLPGAVAEAVRDVPQLVISAYKFYWTTPAATITYDHYLSDYNNSERPGGGDGTLDLSTGTFTCMTPGYYSLTYSGVSSVDPGERNDIYLYLNGSPVEESQYHEFASPGLGDWTSTQGSRSLVSHHR